MIQIKLPEHVESRLRESIGDLDQAATEAALVELFRQGQITHHELGEALGLSRFETDGLLKRHNVTEDLPTTEEYREELEAARRVLARLLPFSDRHLWPIPKGFRTVGGFETPWFW